MQRLTQSDLGNKTHMRQATISALENGEAGTQIKTLTDIQAALNLEIIIQERTSGSDIESILS